MCYPYTDKAMCDKYEGLFCTPKPCKLAGCKSCSADAEECYECEDNHILLSYDTCASLNTVFAGISDSSFVLSGNLVLLSNKQIADSLTAGFAGVKGKSRYAAMRHAIAAFSHRFKDQFDAVAVFPSTQQQKDKGYSTYTRSQQYTWKSDYDGAPKLLRSIIIHNMYTQQTVSYIPYKHEILHRFGVFNKLIPTKTGNSWVYSHWGLSAIGNARGQLGGWPRSAVDCTNGNAPSKNANPACPGNKLRFAVGKGSTGSSNDNTPMSEFELLMMGLIGPNEISGDIIVCDATGSKVSYGLEKVGDYYVGDCVAGIKFVSPADFESNINMNNKDANRLKPRGKSNPHMRVANLVVYASDAERDEAMSDGPKGQSALRDSKKWLDSYLDDVRASWAKDTTVKGKQLSSLTFRVRDCHRKGKTNCDGVSTTPAPTTAPPPAGKECTPGKQCCDKQGLFASTAVECTIAGKKKNGYCNAGVCEEPSGCDRQIHFSQTLTVTLYGYCGISSPCVARCKSTDGKCYNTGAWSSSTSLANGAYCVKNGVRGRCKGGSCEKLPPTTTAAPTTTKATTKAPATTEGGDTDTTTAAEGGDTDTTTAAEGGDTETTTAAEGGDDDKNKDKEGDNDNGKGEGEKVAVASGAVMSVTPSLTIISVFVYAYLFL